MKATLRTGDVVKQTGVNREALRFYESKGLIPKPYRTANGYRAYPAKVVYRLRFLKRAQAIGFSLKEIKALLELERGPKTTCASAKKIADAKLAEIEAKIQSLTEMKNILTEFSKACAKGKARQCDFLLMGQGNDPCC